MNYYIREAVFDEVRKRTAGSKAREDINEVAEKMGFVPIEVEYDYSLRKEKGLLFAMRKLSRDWKGALSGIGSGDVVLVQYPLNHHPMGIPGALKSLQKRGGKVIFLIHDIDCLRAPKNTFMNRLKYYKIKHEDYSILKCADALIAHNNKMIEVLAGMGIDREKLISLRIFDYLIHEEAHYKERDLSEPVIIAGTLRKHKAGYVYSLPDCVNFNLYGVGYENKEVKNVHYFGSFNPEELTQIMEGSFGLVWDGSSCETCDGMSGVYIRLNNPHKLSLYLAAGLPVAVWDQAAVADFVREENVGIAVKSISGIRDAVERLSEENYREMEENARKISKKLICGTYARSAITKALDMVSGQVV